MLTLSKCVCLAGWLVRLCLHFCFFLIRDQILLFMETFIIHGPGLHKRICESTFIKKTEYWTCVNPGYVYILQIERVENKDILYMNDIQSQDCLHWLSLEFDWYSKSGSGLPNMVSTQLSSLISQANMEVVEQKWRRLAVRSTLMVLTVLTMAKVLS